MSGLVFGGVGHRAVPGLRPGRGSVLRREPRGVRRRCPFGVGATGSQSWWVLAIATTVCLASMVNLVLLAENRLSLPTENRVTPLRVGFLVQFLLIAAWTLSFINEPPRVRSNAVEALGVIGGLHLAVVAMFTVTEDLVVPRRVLLRMKPSSPWRWLLAMFRPGGGRGAIYVLVQMALLLVAAWLLRPTWLHASLVPGDLRLYLLLHRRAGARLPAAEPASAASLQLRVAVLVLLPALDAAAGHRPLRAVAAGRPRSQLLRPPSAQSAPDARELDLVETRDWFSMPLGLGLTGLLAYLALIHMGTRMTVQPAPIDPHGSAAAAGEPGRANVLY